MNLHDNDLGITFSMVVMYPTKSPAKSVSLGPYNMNLSLDAAIVQGRFPLSIISHGSGGSHLVYRTLAHYLASNGFIVGMLEHPFNNRNNNSWGNTIENLVNRPRHLQIAIDWFFDNAKFASHILSQAVSVIGHSMGGYTALVLAGGKPTVYSTEPADGHCQEINTTLDLRITSLVLLAPATIWFRYIGALTKVKLPVLLLAAEKDEYTPYFHSQIVVDGVPDKTKVQHRIIKNAGHFSFLSPFPTAMNCITFAPSQDPPGFDRIEFHHELHAEVLKFLLAQIENP
jgi:predicted dienelactone hydrolase